MSCLNESIFSYTSTSFTIKSSNKPCWEYVKESGCEKFGLTIFTTCILCPRLKLCSDLSGRACLSLYSNTPDICVVCYGLNCYIYKCFYFVVLF